MTKVTKTSVRATNNYNKSFGIEAGNIYEAEKIVDTYEHKEVDRYGHHFGNQTYSTTSYTVNGMNFQGDDFEEVE